MHFIMNDDIEQIYKEISQDPELFQQLVIGYLNKHPNSNKEEIASYIMKLIANELNKEADEEKIRLQKDITRDRILCKALDCLPDSGDIKSKKGSIKEAIGGISNSSTCRGREKLAELLTDCTTSAYSKIRKRKSASDEIGGEIKNAK